MNRLLRGLLVLSGLSCAVAVAQAEDDQTLIERARSAAPSMVSADATVMYQGRVLAEGSNGWTCLPETMPGDMSPICNDAVWMEALQAVGGKAPFEAKQMGFSYMLGGDGGVSNSDPYHPDHVNADDFIKEGPHLMVIVPREALEGMTTDPHAGGPYVMWKDTPYAHIMIPVGERE
ncbi:hypothetical protein ADIMK_2338 [Marinobacterium lacunae]|uniref:Uncharacterized protein n=1 Tax=Marinobacterium lacunae TaxID=1232683 RepID=A0A081FYF4_9GAMM|nr:hypothetical protein [Marinobacterium lacunae]KEA63559.1 hypothetical protein ADIMK_2338 [Marinobacterium lacunae]MBR9885742.1 hypothetical protein [Oceanospirillales bacterium]